MDVGGRATTVLVEGESDRVAVETLAERSGHDLAALGVAVVPMGGATSVRGFLERYGPSGADHRLLVLCDAAEQAYVERAVDRAGLTGAVPVHVCRADLEDELVHLLGTDAVLEVIAGQGELGSFRLLQRQPALRDRPLEAQLHRFFAGRSGHKITYARLLVDALPPGVAPAPSPLSSRPRRKAPERPRGVPSPAARTCEVRTTAEGTPRRSEKESSLTSAVRRP